jgi:putative addiction module component (TIGR02574 family)
MDMTAVLRAVDAWPVEERLRLVEAIWERIIETGAEPELTEAQRVELDRRLAALETTPADVVPWEAVQEYVRRPR